jgi:hypothetical protein
MAPQSLNQDRPCCLLMFILGTMLLLRISSAGTQFLFSEPAAINYDAQVPVINLLYFCYFRHKKCECKGLL